MRRKQAHCASVLAALLALGGLPGIAAVAAPRPDLIVSRLAEVPAAALPGKPIKVESVVKNTGAAKSGASTTRFYLSKDKVKDGNDRQVGADPVAGLDKGETEKSTTSLQIPGTLQNGSMHFLLACADAKRKVAESSEDNNCRSNTKKIEIVVIDPSPFGDGSPVDVQPVLGADTVTEMISAHDGGTIELTSGGTKYVLTFPPGSLFSDDNITMTVVNGIGSSPLDDPASETDGYVAGVKLGPEGLILDKPARLEIQLAGGMPPAEQWAPVETPFSADGNGKDFHLYPLRLNPNTITFDLLHFSIFGLFKTSQERREAQVVRQARDAENALSQVHQKELGLARQQALLGNDEPGDEVFEVTHESSTAYYERVLRPIANLGRTNSKYYFDALRRALGLTRKLALVGVEGEDVLTQAQQKELGRFLREGFINYVNELLHECVRNHNLHLIRVFLMYERQAQLLGSEEDQLPPGTQERLRRCMGFQLELDTEIETTFTMYTFPQRINEWSGEVSAHLNGKFNFTLPTKSESENRYPVEEDQQPGNLIYKAVGGKLTSTGGGACEDTLIGSIPNLPNFALKDVASWFSVVTSDKMRLNLNSIAFQAIPMEKASEMCFPGGNPSGPYDQVLATYLEAFRKHHPPVTVNRCLEPDPVGPGQTAPANCVFEGPWQPINQGADMAILEIEDHSYIGNGISTEETTTFTLRHRPQG